MLLLFGGASGGAPTPPLMRNSSLNGLGASGPFFHDALASIILIFAVLIP